MLLITWGSTTAPVLVIEDDRDIAQVYSFALQLAGQAVEIQYNGADAWQRLQQSAPAAVILDLHLPGMDGSEIFRRMRQDGKLREVPVVIVTADPPLAHAIFTEAQRAGALPPESVFCKPLELDQLIQWARGVQ